MNTQITTELILNIVHFLVVIAIIAITAKKTGRGRGLFAALFLFGMVAFALEDVYWIAYDAIRPESRMPFAANEIACSAALLLLGAAMETKAGKDLPHKAADLVISVFFIAVNVVLWIIWSGEWFEDLVFAAPYVYYMYALLRRIRSLGGLKKWAAFALSAFFTCLYAAWFISLRTGEHVTGLINNINYLSSEALILILFVSAICLYRKEDGKEKAAALSFAATFWTILAAYMSDGVFYSIALFANILSLLLLQAALLTEAQNDLR